MLRSVLIFIAKLLLKLLRLVVRTIRWILKQLLKLICRLLLLAIDLCVYARRRAIVFWNDNNTQEKIKILRSFVRQLPSFLWQLLVKICRKIKLWLVHVYIRIQAFHKRGGIKLLLKDLWAATKRAAIYVWDEEAEQTSNEQTSIQTIEPQEQEHSETTNKAYGFIAKLHKRLQDIVEDK